MYYDERQAENNLEVTNDRDKSKKTFPNPALHAALTGFETLHAELEKCAGLPPLLLWAERPLIEVIVHVVHEIVRGKLLIFVASEENF